MGAAKQHAKLGLLANDDFDKRYVHFACWSFFNLGPNDNVAIITALNVVWQINCTYVLASLESVFCPSFDDGAKVV